MRECKFDGHRCLRPDCMENYTTPRCESALPVLANILRQIYFIRQQKDQGKITTSKAETAVAPLYHLVDVAIQNLGVDRDTYLAMIHAFYIRPKAMPAHMPGVSCPIDEHTCRRSRCLKNPPEPECITKINSLARLATLLDSQRKLDGPIPSEMREFLSSLEDSTLTTPAALGVNSILFQIALQERINEIRGS